MQSFSVIAVVFCALQIVVPAVQAEQGHVRGFYRIKRTTMRAHNEESVPAKAPISRRAIGEAAVSAGKDIGKNIKNP